MPEKNELKRQKKALYDAEYRTRNKDKRLTQSKEYYLSNSVAIKEKSAIRYQNNKEQYLERCKKDYAENKHQRSAKKAEWKQINKHMIASYSASRRAIRIKATPSWSDKNKINEFYETANGLSMITGDWYHVDHIIPLKSKLVCGLHTHGNLRVITAKENLLKFNNFTG